MMRSKLDNSVNTLLFEHFFPKYLQQCPSFMELCHLEFDVCHCLPFLLSGVSFVTSLQLSSVTDIVESVSTCLFLRFLKQT